MAVRFVAVTGGSIIPAGTRVRVNFTYDCAPFTCPSSERIRERLLLGTMTVESVEVGNFLNGATVEGHALADVTAAEIEADALNSFNVFSDGILGVTSLGLASVEMAQQYTPDPNAPTVAGAIEFASTAIIFAVIGYLAYKIF